jgi:ATP-binding cassette subfamily F protein uup
MEKENDSRIEKLEKQISSLHKKMAEPAFYKQESKEIKKTQDRIKNIEAQLDAAFHRWEFLEEKNNGAA